MSFSELAFLQEDNENNSQDEARDAGGGSRKQHGDLYADSSDDNVPGAEDSSARAHARGHGGGGFMSSLQSKWDTMWGKKSEADDDAPEEWQQMQENGAGTSVRDESEELVGDRYGTDEDGEDARVWGMHDEHRRGNVYTPGEETGCARPPPKIVDRGSIADSSIAERAAGEDAGSAKVKSKASLSDKYESA